MMVTSLARALHFGLAERHDVLAVRHVALHVVEHLALDENDRVVVADRALEQPLGVGRRGRRDDLEPGDVGVKALERLGMLRAELQSGAAGPAENGRDAHLASRHVAHLGGRVDQLVDARAERSSRS